MRLAEVLDVDVVADRGAVRRVVVVAEDADLRPPARRRRQHERDEVRLGVVRLAAARGGAGGVEVAQGDEPQAVGPVEALEQALDEELRPAVGVDRPLRVALRDRDLGRDAVGGAGRGEDDPLHARRHERLEEDLGLREVVVEVAGGLRHRLADVGERGEVDAGVERVLAGRSGPRGRGPRCAPRRRRPPGGRRRGGRARGRRGRRPPRRRRGAAPRRRCRCSRRRRSRGRPCSVSLEAALGGRALPGAARVVVVLEEPAVGRLDPLAQPDAVAPAERVEPRDVEELLRRAVGLRRVEDERRVRGGRCRAPSPRARGSSGPRRCRR